MDATRPRMLSAYNTLVSSDLDETRERISQAYCAHRLALASRAPALAAWQNIARIKRISVSAMGYGADVLVEPQLFGDFYLIMLPYAGEAVVSRGTQQLEGDLQLGAVVNPTDSVNMRWSADGEALIVRIEREALEQQLTLLLGRSQRETLSFQLAMPVQGRQASWWQFVRLLVDELERECPDGSQRETLMQLESLLIISLLESQPSNYSVRLQCRQRDIAPRHVRLVERYIDEFAQEPISLDKLVEISEVSGRALFDGFRRFRQTSPMAYLRTVRMQRVREDLLRTGETASVAEVATRWGFWELGRFAGQYRRHFGELPSETMRRR